LDSLFEFLGIGYPGGFLGTVDMLADTAYAVTDPRITLLDIIGKVKTYSGGEFRVPLWFTDSVTSDFNPPTLRIGLHPDATPCTDDSLGEYPAITECGLFSQHCAHFEPPKDTMCGEGNYPAFLDLRYLSGTTQIDTYRVSFVGTPPVVLHWPPNLASWYDSCRLLDRPSMFFGLPPKIDVDMLAMDSVVVSGIPPPFQGDLIIRAVGPRVVTAVNELGGILPLQLSLSQNYPNPFNPSTRITFRLTSSSMVSVKIYDVLGQAITTLTNERLGAGEHTVEWHAGGLPGGVYIYRLVAGRYVETRKMVLVK
jgi:hypothetical protein